MEIETSLSIIKALSDKSRLFILNALLEKPHYVEEIAKRLKLAASTVSFHLKKLENAGLVTKSKDQYYIIYSIEKKIFDTKLRDIISFDNLEETAQKDRLNTYKEKVLNTFFKDGRLIQIPRQYKKRWIVLERFIELFEYDKDYPEKEVDEKISKLYDDYCSIRRYLIDDRIFKRSKGIYRLNKELKFDGLVKKAYNESIKKR